MTGFVLKIIGTIAMVLNHLSYTNDNLIIPLFYIGRMALPIFAFLIVEGYKNTRSFKNYLIRILVFAIIAQLPFYYFVRMYINPDVSFLYLNTLFTFAAGLISLKLFDIIKEKLKKTKILGFIVGLLPVIIIASLTDYLNFDYALLTIIMMFIFYVLKNHRAIAVWAYTILLVAFLGKDMVQGMTFILNVDALRNVLFQLLGYEVAMGCISVYNGKRGKDGKACRLFFYFFYPIHFVLLMILSIFM